MGSIFLGICTGLFTFLVLSFFRNNKKHSIVPCTKWRHNNLEVEAIYVTDKRIYFRTLSTDTLASMPIDDFIFQFEPIGEEDVNTSS